MASREALGLSGVAELPALNKLKDELNVTYMEGGIEISAALTALDEKIADAMTALEIALEKEYLSYDFYKRASALLEKQDVKALLHELAAAEREHAGRLIERLKEYLQKR